MALPRGRFDIRISFSSQFCFFRSGAAALVYQVLWIKQLSLVVGVEIYSIALAVSAFFAGLALGSSALGRLADRVERSFLLYAALESGIALLGVGATLLLAHAAEPFAAMETHVGALAWVLPFAIGWRPCAPDGRNSSSSDSFVVRRR